MHKFERFPQIEEKPNVWQTVKEKFRKFLTWISLTRRSKEDKGKALSTHGFFKSHILLTVKVITFALPQPYQSLVSDSSWSNLAG